MQKLLPDIMAKFKELLHDENYRIHFRHLDIKLDRLIPNLYYIDLGYIHDAFGSYNQIVTELNEKNYAKHPTLSASYEDSSKPFITANYQCGAHLEFKVVTNIVHIIFYNTKPDTLFDLFNRAHDECEAILSMSLGHFLVEYDYLPFLPMPRETACYLTGFRKLQKLNHSLEDIYKMASSGMSHPENLKEAWDIFSENYIGAEFE